MSPTIARDLDDINHVAFEILGLPASQGSKTRMPNGAMLEGGSKVGREKQKAWRHSVSATARDIAADLDEPMDGPLDLSIKFRFPMPKSRPARARERGLWPHMVKPDIDKVLRCTLDGLTDGGLIRDDARIFRVCMSAHEVTSWTGAVVEITKEEW